MSVFYCPNCGTIISENAKECECCGYNLKSNSYTVSDKNFSYDSNSHYEDYQYDSMTKRNLFPIILITLVVCFLVFLTYAFLNGSPISNLSFENNDSKSFISQSNAKNEANVSENKVQIPDDKVGDFSPKKPVQIDENKYFTYLQTIAKEIFKSASGSLDYGEIINSVWNNAIYEIHDEKTDLFTKVDGRFVSDFNTALNNLYADEDFLESLDKLETRRDQIKEMLDTIANPPEKYIEYHQELISFFDCYCNFVDLLISQDGYSLTEFKKKYSEMKDSLFKCYDSLKETLDIQ